MKKRELIGIGNCKSVRLPRIDDTRGSLVFIQRLDFLPFDIKRVYYMFDLDTGSQRGGHAHLELNQLLVAVSGSFVLNLDDGKNKKSIHLTDPGVGVLITPMIWRDIEQISANAVCLVLASLEYSESDYIRDYDHFKKKTLANGH